MKTYALYGLIYSMATTFLALLSYFAGLQTDNIGAGMYVQYALLAGFMAVLYLGVKERRESLPDQKMGFGAALGGAMMISLVAGILGAAYSYFHFSKIHPSFGEYMVQYQQAKMEAAGLPDNMIEKITSDMARGFTPTRQAINALVGSILLGLVFGLMLAPGHTQRGSINRIAIVNGSICGFFGLLGGAANGLLYRSIGSSALLGLLVGGGGGWLVTYLLLKFTNYTPRFADEASD